MSSTIKYGKTSLTTAIAAALAPVPQGALAQDQDAAESSDRVLEEVIVTATFREASMQDLPQSLQAFTSEDIKRAAFTNFTDVANAIPSLTLIADQPGRNSVKFRGVSTGTGEYYTGSTSAIYFDETPMTFVSQQLWPAMVDIESIESLPGPQGTLYGSSSLSGTVRVISQKPDPSAWSGEVYGEYFSTDGGDGSYALEGWLNLPLIKDTLALRLVAHTRKEGGWIDNVYGETYVQPDSSRFVSPGNNAAVVEDNYNEYSLTGGRGSLLWNMTDNWQAIVAIVAEDNSNEGAWGDDTNLPDNQHSLFHDENRDDEWWNASLLITGDLGFATLTSSTTYLDREIKYEFDNMIYEQWKDSYFGVYYGFALYNSEYTYGYLFNDQTQDRVSQELRLASNTDSRFSWMVGGFYEEINDQWFYGAFNPDYPDTLSFYYANYLAYYYSYYGYDVQYPLPATDLGYTQRLDRTTQQIALFGELTFEITDKWWVTGGARWFDWEQDYLEQNQFPEGLPPAGSYASNGVVTSKGSNSDVVFKFSTQYFFNDDIMAYALYSEGFRPGGTNSQRAVAAGGLPEEYQPDYVNNYEFGVKSEWLNNSLQINATFFYLDWKDRHFSVGTDEGFWWLRGTINGDDTENKGVELSVTWQATDNLRLNGSLTSQDSKTVTTGDPLPNAPDLSYYIAADYTFPFQVFGGDLWTRIDYAYGDEWWTSGSGAADRDPDSLIPDWSNTNLQVGLSLPNDWNLTAFVRNLTDERRINGRSNNSYASDWFGVPNHRIIDYVQRPRHYGVSVRKSFY